MNKVIRILKKPHEIIFIDDGSTDNSYQILKGIHRKDSSVKIIRLTRNFGQHPSIMAGFNIAKGDIIITMDADLQNPPEAIPQLLKKLDEGYEIVFGVLTKRKHSLFRRMGSRFSKWILAKILPEVITDLSGFRVLRSYTVTQLKSLNEKSRFIDGLLCWMGYKVGTISVEQQKRYSGKTKYSPFKLIGLWLNMVVALTDLPLKIATFGGISLGIVGFILALFYFIRYLFYGFSVPGFATGQPKLVMILWQSGAVNFISING